MDTAKESKSIVVTPQMLDAGFRILAKSGIADEYLEADKLKLEKIYRAMFALAPASTMLTHPVKETCGKNCKAD
jgi:hypothetical protein